MKTSLQPVFPALMTFALLSSAGTAMAASDDAQTVAALDTTYQAAVKANDAEGMADILHRDFLLVDGTGKQYSREALLAMARNKAVIYEHQEEEAGSQVVHVFGDTAVVTACLWLKGATKDGSSPFDWHVWFSDTYVRTPTGWQYALGQASLPLPPKAG
jgi:uncharacterized protein (TIGR02246 family)